MILASERHGPRRLTGVRARPRSVKSPAAHGRALGCPRSSSGRSDRPPARHRGRRERPVGPVNTCRDRGAHPPAPRPTGSGRSSQNCWVPLHPKHRVYRVGSARRQPLHHRGLTARTRRADRRARPEQRPNPPPGWSISAASSPPIPPSDGRLIRCTRCRKGETAPRGGYSGATRRLWTSRSWIAAATPWRRHAACRPKRPAADAPAGHAARR